MLEVLLLGAPQVTVDGQPVEVDTRKAIALLAYMAVESAASRDTATGLLWAEAPPDRARATLRRTLSSLRHGIGEDSLRSDRNRISLTPDTRVDLDIFEAEISATGQHEHPSADVCQECIPHLVTATSLYRGDFLQGFAVRDAPEFEDWCRGVAESLRLRMGGACHRLAMGLAAGGDYPGAISAARRWIDLDELHEPAHRLLMLLHAWAGDRPGAIAAYLNFVAILDRELGVAPLDETTELYEAILDEDLPPAPGARKRIQINNSPRPVFEFSEGLIDRQSELDLLRSWWQDAQTSGKVGLVVGEAWMGKTRLIEELSREVSNKGHRVLTGRAFRTEQGLPFGVAVQILRRSDAANPARESIPSWAAEEVARLLPGSHPTSTPESADRSGELRLFEAIYETVAAATTSGSLLVVVDDVQWSDHASAGVIGYLARRASELPVLMVLVARSGERIPSPIEDVTKAAATLTLGPLTESDISDLADAPESVIAHTGGVPILVREMLHGSDGDTSGSVSSYLEHRMSDLSDLAQQILTTAAVLTGTCDTALLREASGRSEEEVVEAVEELLAAGLLREMPDIGELGFTLEFLERTAYGSLSAVRRQLLHRRAAEALATRARSESDLRIASAVAGHFHAAGDQRAGGWYRTAGDLARSVHANEEAREFYGTAISLGSDLGEIRLALGELAMIRGDYPTALRELTMASIGCEGPALGRVEHRLGELHRLLGRFDLADEHYERAVASHPHPATVHADRALLYQRMGRSDRALEEASAALAASALDRGLESRARNVSGVVAEDDQEALAHLDHALGLAGDDWLARMAALNNKAYVLARMGEVDAAVELVTQASDIAASTGYRHQQAALHNHLADLHHEAGRSDRAAEELTRAVALFADIDAGSWEPEVWLLTRW